MMDALSRSKQNTYIRTYVELALNKRTERTGERLCGSTKTIGTLPEMFHRRTAIQFPLAAETRERPPTPYALRPTPYTNRTSNVTIHCEVADIEPFQGQSDQIFQFFQTRLSRKYLRTFILRCRETDKQSER